MTFKKWRLLIQQASIKKTIMGWSIRDNDKRKDLTHLPSENGGYKTGLGNIGESYTEEKPRDDDELPTNIGYIKIYYEDGPVTYNNLGDFLVASGMST